jgi:hypothetical protein
VQSTPHLGFLGEGFVVSDEHGKPVLACFDP